MAQRERVILIHGLWMYPFVMTLMQHRISRCGYDVACWSYPTVRATLETNARSLARYCAERADATLHLVGHSMGGLIALHAAALAPLPHLKRIVAAGTPLADSFSARHLERLPGGRAFLGECIGEWLRGPRTRIAAGLQVGVIAGNGGIGLGRVIAPGLPQPNDGVITVAETKIDGLTDHIVLDVSHTEMLASVTVAQQVCAFLQDGRFDRAREAR